MRGDIITISSGTIFRVFLIGGFLWVLYFLRDFILVLLTAVVIASAIEPFTSWFVKNKIPRVLAVIFIYLFTASLFTGIFYFFLPPLLEDIAGITTILPEYIETFESRGLFEEFVSFKTTIAEIRQVVVGSGAFIQHLSAIFGGVVSFILIVIISFYLAVQEKGIEKLLELITPARHEKYVISLWERSQKKIGLWMQGQLLLGLIVGVLVYLGLTILEVKYAFLLAVLAALFEIIPLFGPIFAAAPAVMLGFLDSVSLGFMVAGLYVIIQQFENHLIYPLVVRKVVGISPILVIIALIVGANLAGFLGLILAIPVSAALVEFLEDIQKEKYASAQKSGV